MQKEYLQLILVLSKIIFIMKPILTFFCAILFTNNLIGSDFKNVTKTTYSNSLDESQLKFRDLDSNFIFIGYRNRKKYYLSKDRFTWSEADKFSKRYPNLRLAIIKDSITNKFIADSVLKYFKNVNGNTNENIIHIGAKYYKKYNQFRFIDLSPLTFVNWRGGHPKSEIVFENMELGMMMFAGNNESEVRAEWLEAGDLSGWWFVAEQNAYNEIADTIKYDSYSMFSTHLATNCDSLPAKVNFLNESTNGSSYKWDFGDGSNISTEINPTHFYTSKGRYKITLITENSFSKDTSTYEIVIGGCPIEYNSFQNKRELLYPWKGRNIIMLTQQNNLDTNIMKQWVFSLDNAYDYYKSITNREPNIISDKYFFNLRTIAQVNSTCGAGCGYLGASGIEYLRSFFNVDYLRILNGRGINHIPFYELGRNFWFYEDKVEYKENSGSIATGFAIFMRYKSIENQPYKFTFESISIDSLKSETKSLYLNLIKDTSCSWQKNIFEKKGINGKFYNYSSSDIIASILFYLSDNYGDSNYLKKFFNLLDSLPKSNSTQTSIDNFIIASSIAANKNLSCFFKSMKFPISDNVIRSLEIYSSPVVPPLVNSNASVCIGTKVSELTATASAGNSLRWYGTSATGGTASSTAPIPTSNTVGTTNYFVSQVNANGCESDRAMIAFTVNDKPTAPSVSNASVCIGGTVPALNATASAGNSLRWYGTNASGGTASSTAPIPTSNMVGTTNYFVSQVNANGCESDRAMIAFTVNDKPIVPAITWNGVELSVPNTFASYQWLLNNNPVIGAISNLHKPLNPGAYRVRVSTASGCSDTSAVFSIVVTAVVTPTLDGKQIQIYPNPVQHSAFIDLGQTPQKPVNVQLLTLDGRRLAQWVVTQRRQELPLGNISNGTYFIQVQNGKRTATLKIIKQ